MVIKNLYLVKSLIVLIHFLHPYSRYFCFLQVLQLMNNLFIYFKSPITIFQSSIIILFDSNSFIHIYSVYSDVRQRKLQ